jgi:hypothetical protein
MGCTEAAAVRHGFTLDLLGRPEMLGTRSRNVTVCSLLIAVRRKHLHDYDRISLKPFEARPGGDENARGSRSSPRRSPHPSTCRRSTPGRSRHRARRSSALEELRAERPFRATLGEQGTRSPGVSPSRDLWIALRRAEWRGFVRKDPSGGSRCPYRPKRTRHSPDRRGFW